MLPRQNRLSRAALLTKPTRRARFKYGSVAYLSHISRGYAVVVPKKVSKTAPARNKMRRRIYAAIKNVDGRYTGGVVIYPTIEALKAPFSDLQKSLADIL